MSIVITNKNFTKQNKKKGHTSYGETKEWVNLRAVTNQRQEIHIN